MLRLHDDAKKVRKFAYVNKYVPRLNPTGGVFPRGTLQVGCLAQRPGILHAGHMTASDPMTII